MEAILWITLGLTTVVSGFVTLVRPGALVVGRIALGLLMVLGGAAVNAYYLATGVDYGDFADRSMFGFVTDTWRSVVDPRQTFFIGLLVAFEVTVGVLVLWGGRAAVWGMVAVIGFHFGLMFFGWIFWIWAVSAIVGVALLLRAQLAENRSFEGINPTMRRPVNAART
jgi:hypothetical protein